METITINVGKYRFDIIDETFSLGSKNTIVEKHTFSLQNDNLKPFVYRPSFFTPLE
jgi:hypothetical protein